MYVTRYTVAVRKNSFDAGKVWFEFPKSTKGLPHQRKKRIEKNTQRYDQKIKVGAINWAKRNGGSRRNAEVIGTQKANNTQEICRKTIKPTDHQGEKWVEDESQISGLGRFDIGGGEQEKVVVAEKVVLRGEGGGFVGGLFLRGGRPIKEKGNRQERRERKKDQSSGRLVITPILKGGGAAQSILSKILEKEGGKQRPEIEETRAAVRVAWFENRGETKRLWG